MNQSAIQIKKIGRGIRVIKTVGDVEEVLYSGGDAKRAENVLIGARRAERAERAKKAEQDRQAQFPHAVGEKPASDAPAVPAMPSGPVVSLTEQFASDLRTAAFIIETVAHFQNMTREYCPLAERLRKIAAGA